MFKSFHEFYKSYLSGNVTILNSEEFSGQRINKSFPLTTVTPDNSINKSLIYTSYNDLIEKAAKGAIKANHKYLYRFPSANGEEFDYVYGNEKNLGEKLKDFFSDPFKILARFNIKANVVQNIFNREKISTNYGVDLNSFACHVLEYKANKAKWDKRFSKLKESIQNRKPQKEVAPETSTKEKGICKEQKDEVTNTAEKTNTRDEIFKPNVSLMRKIWSFYNPVAARYSDSMAIKIAQQQKLEEPKKQEAPKDKAEENQEAHDNRSRAMLGNQNAKKDFTETDKKLAFDRIKNNAVEMLEIPYEKKEYEKLFPRGEVKTPFETVKLGEHQFERLAVKDGGTRKNLIGAMYQTLKEPCAVIEDVDKQNREAKLYIKSFIGKDKNKYTLAVVVNIDGKLVSVSFGERKTKQIEQKIKTATRFYYVAADSPTIGTGKEQPLPNNQNNTTQSKEKSSSKLTPKQQENLEKITRILEKNAEPMPDKIEFTRENFDKLFMNGVVTPIEHVKIGENQYEKLEVNNREGLLAAMADVLKNPALIIKTDDNAKLYVKTYKSNAKEKNVLSVVVDKGNISVSISTHIERNVQLAKKMASILYSKTEAVHGENPPHEETSSTDSTIPHSDGENNSLSEAMKGNQNAKKLFSSLTVEEKRQKKEQIENNIVSSIPKDSVPYNGDGKFDRAAKEWLINNNIGNAQTNIGEVVINRRSVERDMHHGVLEDKYLKLQTLPSVKDILEKGTYLGYEHNMTSDDDIDNHYFAGKIKYGDEEKIVFCRVRKAAGDTERFYVHEVFTEEEIKKGLNNTVTDGSLPLLIGKPLFSFILRDVLNVKGNTTKSNINDARFGKSWCFFDKNGNFYIHKSVLIETERKKKLDYFKRELLAHLDSLMNQEKATVNKSSGNPLFLIEKSGRALPVGTIRIWSGKKYIKQADKRWAPYYEKQTRGTLHAIAALKRKMSACETAEDMMQLVLLNRDRFTDKNGYPLPIVQELSKYIDEAQNESYNKNKEKTDDQRNKNNRSGIDTARKNRLREVQERYRNEVTRIQQRKADSGIHGGIRERLTLLLERRLDAEYGGDSNGNGNAVELNNFKIYKNVKGEIFREIFWLHKSHLKNKELVDFPIYKGSYDDCACFLSSDGLQGFAIEPNGNIISVYNADIYDAQTNPNGKSGWTRTMSEIAQKNGGNRLDCYDSVNQPLARIYSKYGFKEVSRMPYNMEYDHDDIAEKHYKPDVVFMAVTDRDITPKKFNADEYDKAEQYRNDVFEEKGKLKVLNKQELHDFIEKHKTSKENVRVSLGNISNEAQNRIKEKTGLLVDRVIFDSDSIRHAYSKPQHNLEPNDLDNMFDVINTTNDITVSEKKYNNNTAIVFREEVENGVFFVQEFRAGKGELELITAYRVKKNKPSQTTPATTSKNGTVPKRQPQHDVVNDDSKKSISYFDGENNISDDIFSKSWCFFDRKCNLYFRKSAFAIEQEKLQENKSTGTSIFLIEKSRRTLPVGTIRIWSGKKYIKQANMRWVPYKESNGLYDSYPEKNYPEYKGKGQEAVDFIVKQKGGQVKGAFNRPEIGDIDVVWGKVTNAQRHKGYGMAHIIDKHGMRVVNKIGDIVKNGEVYRDYKNRLCIGKDDFELALKEEWHGNKKTWIITTYEKKGENAKLMYPSTNYTERIQSETPIEGQTTTPSPQSDYAGESLPETSTNNIPHFNGENNKGKSFRDDKNELAKTSKEIHKTNDEFNNDIEKLKNGELDDKYKFKLGKPSEILLKCGFPNDNIELLAKQLKLKMNIHKFSADEIKDLPLALQNPLAVFNYGDGNKSQNVIVNLNKDDKNFVVGIHFNQVDGQISDIRGLFNKDNHEWLNWINQGKARYLNKNKLQALINQQRTNLAEVEYLDLKPIESLLQENNDVNDLFLEEKYLEEKYMDKLNRSKEKSSPKTLSDIRKNYENAKSVTGRKRTITLPNGDRVRCYYKIVEAETPTASHNEKTFAPTDGFPQTEDKRSVNDRDYQNDKDAQESVLRIASNFNSLALESPPIVTKDGIVISGNNRTMSSKIAAKKGTDKQYLQSLKEDIDEYGLEEDDLKGFKHPRVILEVEEELKGKYTTDMFAVFNRDNKKTMNNVEKAVKLTKTLNTKNISNIAEKITGYETMGELYNDKKGSQEFVNALIKNGIIGDNEKAQYTTSDGMLNDTGKDFVETVLVGSVLSESNIRKLDTAGGKLIRKKLVRAILPLVENKGTGSEYSFNNELNEAVNIAVNVMRNREKFPDVQTYLKQETLFDEKKPDEITGRLAEIIHDEKEIAFAKRMKDLGAGLRQSASGEQDIFLSGVETKEELMNRFLEVKKAITELLNELVSEEQYIKNLVAQALKKIA